ncbi:6-phosphogluconate dehydrogenase [Flavobacteriaceae sp. LMIT009]
MKEKTIKSRLKTILFRFLIISGIVFCVVLWICSWTYSEGTRAGNLIKISKKGIVFKTFEGQLNLGGVNLVEGLEGNIWAFTILDDSLAKTSTSFEGKMVKITYKERYKTLPWLGDTNYIVTNIQKVE